MGVFVGKMVCHIRIGVARVVVVWVRHRVEFNVH